MAHPAQPQYGRPAQPPYGYPGAAPVGYPQGPPQADPQRYFSPRPQGEYRMDTLTLTACLTSSRITSTPSQRACILRRRPSTRISSPFTIARSPSDTTRWRPVSAATAAAAAAAPALLGVLPARVPPSGVHIREPPRTWHIRLRFPG